jgi:phosphatidylinositol glycan class B
MSGGDVTFANPATTVGCRERSIPISLAAILALAMLIRLAVIFALPGLNHPDENYQLFEQAHRLAFGYGVKPWEFSDGLRSWVVPAILAGVFAVFEPLLGGPEGYIHAAQIVLAGASLAPVAAVYAMGRRISPTHDRRPSLNSQGLTP